MLIYILSASVSNEMRQLKEKGRIIEERNAKVAHNIEELKSNELKKEDEIKTQFKSIRKVLQDKQHELIDKLHLITSQQISSLLQYRQQYALVYSSLQAFLSQLDQLSSLSGSFFVLFSFITHSNFNECICMLM